MRLREIVRLGFSYFKEHEGRSRKTRRMLAVTARPRGAAKTKPRNWNRDKHERRKEQKRRRKQSWR
jgi:hypothetical protein